MRRVMIVDDHALVATTLTGALRTRGYDARAWPPTDDDQILREAKRFQPSVVLLDLHLGERRSGVPLIEPLRHEGAQVVVLTATTDVLKLAECVEGGAGGLLSKGAHIDEVVRVIEAAATGAALSDADRRGLLERLRRHRDEQRRELAPFAELTPREEEVLAALVRGKSAQAIADETFTSVRTVRGHIQGVLDKLDVSSQLAAVARANAVGWTFPQSTDTDES